MQYASTAIADASAGFAGMRGDEAAAEADEVALQKCLDSNMEQDEEVGRAGLERGCATSPPRSSDSEMQDTPSSAVNLPVDQPSSSSPTTSSKQQQNMEEKRK